MTGSDPWLEKQIREYPLLDSLIWRRSRRFGKGFTLNGQPLAFESKENCEPLTEHEEAALAFAACGFTGYALGELPYDVTRRETGGGNILSQFYGRTAPSGDAIHSAYVFVISDRGTYLLKRPSDFEAPDFFAMQDAARKGHYLDFYYAARVQLDEERVDVPRQVPNVPGFNQWSANVPGSTYFLPVHEMTGLLINILLTIFDDQFRYFVVDETASFRPAGIGKYKHRKRGGLSKNPKELRTLPIGTAESWLYEFAAVEQGAILQNLGLMTQAMGLGGFAHFAHHPWVWPERLGFCTDKVDFTQTAGMKWLPKLAAKLLGRDFELTVPLGLTYKGKQLITPYCPPYYPNMKAAVNQYVEDKFGKDGTLKAAGGRSAFKYPGVVSEAIPSPSPEAIAATIDCCTYIYERFGRIPATNGPVRTNLAYQAHHLDSEFYDRFYADALSATQLGHKH
jgi:hypothetical protein